LIESHFRLTRKCAEELHNLFEGKKPGNITCPITFGKIAYQLLNQTLAYVTIEDR